MTLRERLAAAAGVWEGTYTHLTPEGRTIDSFASRQETRLEGDRWFERIVYRWPDGRSQTLDFRARVGGAGGEEMVFDDPRFHGEAFLVGEDVLVFPYRWKDQPERHVVETVVFGADRKSRVWQTFERDELVRVTVIVERRLPDAPAVWT